MKKAAEKALPVGKGRAKRWSETVASGPDVDHLSALLRLQAEAQAHPDAKVKRLVEEHLQALHLNPDLQDSPELMMLVWVFREIVHDFQPGETVDQALEPLLSVMSRRGGGQPSGVDHGRVRAFHARLKGHHDATKQTAEHFDITRRAVRKILEG